MYPNLAANLINIYHPTHGAHRRPSRSIANFANPMQFICSAIQAGSRLGYQESAELCAQYLAPILDAIKFNYLPFGVEPVLQRRDAAQVGRLLRGAAAAAARATRTPPCPGIWSRDTLFSHGNHEPGWIVAPGMQGVEVQPFTANMLTPESLAALMGGPDPALPCPPAFGVPPGGTARPPNAYDQNNPLPPPWYPRPGPPPARRRASDVGAAAAAGLAADRPARHRRPAAPGPMLPAEMGAG